MDEFTYRHYKGTPYQVLHEGVFHTESEELLTIYWGGNFRPYARPQEMFHGNLDDGRQRFDPLGHAAGCCLSCRRPIGAHDRFCASCGIPLKLVASLL